MHKNIILHFVIIVLIMIVFSILKIPYLSLPHYWDESWSYATAIQKMYEQGPTLLPGIVDVEATRGHPLFYYFIAATWMKAFGSTLLSKHLFSLSISLISIWSIYFVSYRLFNFKVAIIATILLCIQIPFFVQSTLLLPEVLIALLSLLTLYYVAIKNYIGLSIVLTLLFLTKESGLTMGFVMFFYFIYILIKGDKKEKIPLLISLSIPLIAIMSFFAYQKYIYGWFLFPEHMGYITKSIERLKSIFIQGFKEMFFTNYKYLFLISSVILITLSFFITKKQPRFHINIRQKSFIGLAMIFAVSYLIFSGLNFYTYRYLLPVLFIGVIFLAVLMDAVLALFNSKNIYIIPLLLLVVMSIFNFHQKRDNTDVSLGMKDAVLTQLDMIEYIEKNIDTVKEFSVPSFQQRINMQNPACGFLKKGKVYTHTKWEIDSNTEFILFDNIEPDIRYEEIKNNDKYKLIFKSHHGLAWGEIYKKE